MTAKNGNLPCIGVFGTGTAVRSLVPILKSVGFSVEAIWGRSKDAAEECARDLCISFFTDKVDEVLLHKEVDLILIFVPPQLQSPIAVKALGIGKHVICGTPSGPTQLEALRMVLAAEYYPTLMSLFGHGFRFLPCFIKMRQLIIEEYIGNLSICEIRINIANFVKDKYDWTCEEYMGGGVLNMYGGLFIDLISFLIGHKATKVHGILRTFTKQTDKIKGIRQITSDDFCSFEMDLGKGMLASFIITSHPTNVYQQEIIVYGSRGKLVVRGLDLTGQKLEQAREEILHRDIPSILDHSKTGAIEMMKTEIPMPLMKGFIKMIDSVKEAFRLVEEKHMWQHDPVALAATFGDQQYVQAVIDAIRRSNRQQEWTKVLIKRDEPDPNLYLTNALKEGQR